MSAQPSTLATAAPLAVGAGFSLVSDLAGAARLLRNLSGVGAGGWMDRLSSPRNATTRINLVLGGGEAIVVRTIGQGSPLLMVHGLGGSHRDWDGAVQTLAQSHRVHTFDLLGHGERASAQGQPALQQMAHDVAEVIAGLGLTRPVLVGHSMGALVVMKYLQDHGAAKLAGVCLIDQSPRITTDEQWKLGLFGSLTQQQLQAALGRLRSDFVETVMTELVARLAVLRSACRPQGLRGRLLRWVLARLQAAVGVKHVLSMLESMADADFREVVARVKVPTMVVLGGASHHYGGLPLEQYYRATLPDGTVRMYKASKHSPHQQEPARFASDLTAFAAKRCA
jgi:non-heme chloroperoxidase